MAPGSLALAVFAWSARRARRASADPASPIAPLEERVFRRFNEGDGAMHLVAWGAMQAGSLAAVGAATGLAVHRRGWRAGTPVALAGTATWLGVKIVKRSVGRERPARYLRDVVVRGAPQGGLGFPSGHAAVAAALALATTRPGPGRMLALGGAAVVGATRLHVGAHLPLDVVGGAAFGLVVGRVFERRS